MTQLTQLTSNSSLNPVINEQLLEETTQPRKTCANCDANGTCTALCLEMEKYLNCGNTTCHKSVGDVGMFDWVPNVISHPGDDPLQHMVKSQVEGEVKERILRYIDGFARKASKGDARKQAMIETMLVLVHLEDYSYARTAEILGETYEEFCGKELIERNNGYQPIQKQKGSRQTLRTCQQFAKYCATTHLSEKIHEVLTTGSMDRVNCL